MIGEIAVGSDDKKLYLNLLQSHLVTELIQQGSIESIDWQAIKTAREWSSSFGRKYPLQPLSLSQRSHKDVDQRQKSSPSLQPQNLSIEEIDDREVTFSHFFSSFLPIITLPLFLFYYDSQHQLEMQLLSLLEAWRLPQGRLPALLFWGELITLILQEQLALTPLIRRLRCRRPDFSEVLSAVQQSVDQVIPLSQAIARWQFPEKNGEWQ